MNANEILIKAQETIIERAVLYGLNNDSNFKRIATMWSAYLSINISPSDVANLMVLHKISRIASGNPNIDNYIDICGYASIGGELEASTSSLK